ncbi:hypothetical protein RRG08_029307 [Elysia crispata]|uniref:Uncharacterized protein n=1 Tax=Elysia crispata TaxID=231223 RepID=A0AAE1A5E8_9GAST|nr:hypothetical protein RRG08_029307 [Elysia crispata]
MEPELPRVQPRPEKTAHTIRRPRARQPTEGFQGSPRVPPRPREDGPYSPAGLGVRHPTEGSRVPQVYNHVSPERTAQIIWPASGETTHRGSQGSPRVPPRLAPRGRPTFCRRPRGETIHLACKTRLAYGRPRFAPRGRHY